MNKITKEYLNNNGKNYEIIDTLLDGFIAIEPLTSKTSNINIDDKIITINTFKTKLHNNYNLKITTTSSNDTEVIFYNKNNNIHLLINNMYKHIEGHVRDENGIYYFHNLNDENILSINFFNDNNFIENYTFENRTSFSKPIPDSEREIEIDNIFKLVNSIALDSNFIINRFNNNVVSYIKSLKHKSN